MIGELIDLIRQYEPIFVLLGFALGVSLGVMMFLWLKSRGPMTKVTAALTDALTASTEREIKLTAALEHSTQTIQQTLTRETQLTAELITIKTARETDRRELDKVRTQYETSCAALGQQITTLQAKIKSQDETIAALRRENERQAARITELEAGARAKDTKIAELETALTASETSKSVLTAEIKALETKMNGKADKPGTGPLTLPAPEPGEPKSEETVPHE